MTSLIDTSVIPPYCKHSDPTVEALLVAAWTGDVVIGQCGAEALDVILTGLVPSANPALVADFAANGPRLLLAALLAEQGLDEMHLSDEDAIALVMARRDKVRTLAEQLVAADGGTMRLSVHTWIGADIDDAPIDEVAK